MGGGEASSDSQRDVRAPRGPVEPNGGAAGALVTAIASLLPPEAGCFAVFEAPGPGEVRLGRGGGSFAAELPAFARWFEIGGHSATGAGVGPLVARSGTLPVAARHLARKCTAAAVPIHVRDGRTLGLLGGFAWAGDEVLSAQALRGLEALAIAFFQGFSRSLNATDSGLKQLSAQERLVAGLLVNGYPVPSVAAVTGLAPDTVRTYIRRLYRKLGVRNRADLVRTVLVSGDAALVSERDQHG
jgi:DNA-binding CsgD family transcriptional regulator